ncbi:MAG: hypothetical protein M3P06_10300 [Acidobacteriota bacterium]|nr:hypothetical protein [Acidobacteriota bacterium]
MSRATLYAIATSLLTVAATAQPSSIYDVDDFVVPRDRGGVVFISRIVVGGAFNFADRYRPLHQNVGFVSIANALYWRDFQFDYKHSEVRGKESGPVVVHVCSGCDEPIYFPTPPSRDSTPAAPRPGSKDSLQFAWYRRSGKTTLRHRATWTYQDVDTVVRSAATDRVLSRLSGNEQSFGLEADTLVRLGGRRIFGLVAFARTVGSGMPSNRARNELTYTSHFPAKSVGSLLLRGKLTVGRVSSQGGTALNVVNPVFEAYWQDRVTHTNIHLVWSPQVTNSGAEGWKTNHQLAVFVDRALFVKLFGRAPSE